MESSIKCLQILNSWYKGEKEQQQPPHLEGMCASQRQYRQLSCGSLTGKTRGQDRQDTKTRTVGIIDVPSGGGTKGRGTPEP